MKKPDSLVVVVKVTALLVSLMITFAFGTAAPDGSTTVPTMLPYTAWARAETGMDRVATKRQLNATALRIPDSLGEKSRLQHSAPGLIFNA